MEYLLTQSRLLPLFLFTDRNYCVSSRYLRKARGRDAWANVLPLAKVNRVFEITSAFGPLPSGD